MLEIIEALILGAFLATFVFFLISFKEGEALAIKRGKTIIYMVAFSLFGTFLMTIHLVEENWVVATVWALYSVSNAIGVIVIASSDSQ